MSKLELKDHLKTTEHAQAYCDDVANRSGRDFYLADAYGNASNLLWAGARIIEKKIKEGQ